MTVIDTYHIQDYEYCRRLDLISVTCTAKHIGTSAFEECENMKELILTEAETIPDYMCSGCKNLSRLVQPDSVKYIGDYAFAFCKNLTQWTAPALLSKIGNYAFSFSGIKELILQDHIQLAPKALADLFTLQKLVWKGHEFHPRFIGSYCLEILEDYSEEDAENDFEFVYGIILPELKASYVIGGAYGWICTDTKESALEAYKQAKEQKHSICTEEDLEEAYIEYLRQLNKEEYFGNKTL